MSPRAEAILDTLYYRITGEQRNPGGIKRVIFNDPATVVYWSDGTKTVVKCQHGDEYSPLMGFLMAVMKKSYGNKGNFNEVLKQYVPGYGKEEENG